MGLPIIDFKNPAYTGAMTDVSSRMLASAGKGIMDSLEASAARLEAQILGPKVQDSYTKGLTKLAAGDMTGLDHIIEGRMMSANNPLLFKAASQADDLAKGVLQGAFQRQMEEQRFNNQKELYDQRDDAALERAKVRAQGKNSSVTHTYQTVVDGPDGEPQIVTRGGEDLHEEEEDDEMIDPPTSSSSGQLPALRRSSGTSATRASIESETELPQGGGVDGVWENDEEQTAAVAPSTATTQKQTQTAQSRIQESLQKAAKDTPAEAGVTFADKASRIAADQYFNDHFMVGMTDDEIKALNDEANGYGEEVRKGVKESTLDRIGDSEGPVSAHVTKMPKEWSKVPWDKTISKNGKGQISISWSKNAALSPEMKEKVETYVKAHNEMTEGITELSQNEEAAQFIANAEKSGNRVVFGDVPNDDGSKLTDLVSVSSINRKTGKREFLSLNDKPQLLSKSVRENYQKIKKAEESFDRAGVEVEINWNPSGEAKPEPATQKVNLPGAQSGNKQAQVTRAEQSEKQRQIRLNADHRDLGNLTIEYGTLSSNDNANGWVKTYDEKVSEAQKQIDDFRTGAKQIEDDSVIEFPSEEPWGEPKRLAIGTAGGWQGAQDMVRRAQGVGRKRMLQKVNSPNDKTVANNTKRMREIEEKVKEIAARNGLSAAKARALLEAARKGKQVRIDNDGKTLSLLSAG